MPSPPAQGDDEQIDLATAGFRACAQEAIRFLIEDENLSGDDPLVVGLWRHLALQEVSLDINSIISQCAAEGDSGIQESFLRTQEDDSDEDDEDDFPRWTVHRDIPASDSEVARTGDSETSVCPSSEEGMQGLTADKRTSPVGGNAT